MRVRASKWPIPVDRGWEMCPSRRTWAPPPATSKEVSCFGYVQWPCTSASSASFSWQRWAPFRCRDADSALFTRWPTRRSRTQIEILVLSTCPAYMCLVLLVLFLSVTSSGIGSAVEGSGHVHVNSWQGRLMCCCKRTRCGGWNIDCAAYLHNMWKSTFGRESGFKLRLYRSKNGPVIKTVFIHFSNLLLPLLNGSARVYPDAFPYYSYTLERPKANKFPWLRK